MIELTVDNFAGGGGASFGIEAALGRPIDFAINHSAEAIAVHTANHPKTKHFCEDVWAVDPVEVTGGKPVGLAWFSPDCKHFSKAKGGKPLAKKIRGLAWVAIRWAESVRPRVIMLENVTEFQTWGPLQDDGTPCPKRKGLTFRRWVRQLQNLGYEIDMRELSACDYGAPTTRKRLFIIARCDGLPIIWPAPTHGVLKPYRTAAECIDWSLPCPSIFERKKSLAEATLRRIARGIDRFVVNSPKPFIVTMRGTEGSHLDAASRGVDEPLRTVSAGGFHHALCTPVIVPLTHHGERRGHPLEEPMPTITGAHRGELALIAPTLINTRNGERVGQAPRVHDIQAPFPTVTAQGSQGALVAAFLARHYGGGPGKENDGASMRAPLPTVTTRDHHSLVRAFLVKYHGQSFAQPLDAPLGTLTSKERFGLITIRGTEYYIADIGMRMLVPRELFNAQGFPPDYKIDPIFKGRPLTKTAQVRTAGNSVCPDVAEALVRANVVEQQRIAEVA